MFDREGSAEEDAALIDTARVREWVAARPSSARRSEDRGQFFLRDGAHKIEYAAPIRFEGRALGVLVAAFDSGRDCGQTEGRLIDAAAQQGALAARISSLYEAARSSSVSLAREVERRTAEAEAQRRFTEAIIDSLPVSLYAVDRSYRVVAWNRNRELGGQGIPRRDVLGRNVFEVLTRQPRDVMEAEFKRAFETGEIEFIEQETHAADGTTRHWLVSKVPMRDARGEVSHVITVGEDITARVVANRAVARSEKLAAVGRLAAGVVHEINNPLATIAACAEALESRTTEGVYGAGADVEDLGEYLQLIRSEAFRCKQITNGLLDFSRARAGQQAPVQIGEVIESAARLLLHQTARPFGEDQRRGVGAAPARLGGRGAVAAGRHHPLGERHRRDARGRHAQLARAPRRGGGGRRPRRGLGHGPRHPARNQGAHLRPVLHDQGGRARDGAWTGRLLWYCYGARRTHHGGLGPRHGDDLHDPPARHTTTRRRRDGLSDNLQPQSAPADGENPRRRR